MTKNIFLYIIPLLPPQEDFDINPEEKGWEVAEKEISIPSNPYTHYDKYSKKINLNGNKWLITCRKNQKLNSAIFVFECFNAEYIAEDFVDSNEIYFKYKNECGVFGSRDNQKYLLKIVENNEVMNEFNYLYSEITEKNEFHIVKDLCFILIITYDDELTKKIKDNIIALLTLSLLAHSMEHEFLRNESKHLNQQDVIKVFWGYKFHLLDCPASNIYPRLFNMKMLAINNLLDHRHMDLIESQNKLSSAQTEAVETQSNILTKIHEVETGILFLTLFVIFDVTFIISSEFINPVEEVINRKFGTLLELLIPLIISLIVSFKMYKKIYPPPK